MIAAELPPLEPVLAEEVATPVGSSRGKGVSVQVSTGQRLCCESNKRRRFDAGANAANAPCPQLGVAFSSGGLAEVAPPEPPSWAELPPPLEPRSVLGPAPLPEPPAVPEGEGKGEGLTDVVEGVGTEAVGEGEGEATPPLPPAGALPAGGGGGDVTAPPCTGGGRGPRRRGGRGGGGGGGVGGAGGFGGAEGRSARLE